MPALWSALPATEPRGMIVLPAAGTRSPNADLACRLSTSGVARMIKIGTLCYVVSSCLANPRTQCAVGKIVEVVSLPYDAPDGTYLPGTYYDVRFEGCIFYCRSDKLRPIRE